MTTANEQKLPNLRNAESEVTSLSDSPYPDNFYVGKAIDNGSCFFDLFRQGLEQQRGIEVTVRQLREDCEKFAQNNPPEWFTKAITNSYGNNGQHHSEILDAYAVNIMDNNRWGDLDIEGRILCGEYDVTLHVVEDQSYFKFCNEKCLKTEVSLAKRFSQQ